MMFILAVGLGLPLAVAAIVEASRGNPFAIGVLMVPLGVSGFMAAAAVVRYLLEPIDPIDHRPLSRKADPAKIARLERELGFNEPPLTYEWLDPNGTWHPVPSFEAACTEAARRWAACDPPAMTRSMVRNAEAPTTVAHRPPDPIPGVENIARP